MKVCSKCKEEKCLSAFSKNKYNKDGLQYWCKECIKALKSKRKDVYKLQNKEYYEKNSGKIKAYHKDYRNKNKDTIIKKRRQHYLDNKELILKNNKKNIKKYHKTNAKYKTFANKLTQEEFPKLAEDGVSLEVKCRYCGKYFIPEYLQTQARVQALLGASRGDCYLYCSSNCKKACPVYNQNKFPKGFKKASSREVDPIVRQLTFERDNWECQACGKSVEDVVLHCHHIEGYAQNPRLGNDVENCITLCKSCHKQVHKLPGCNYFELRCKE